jgi:hypothetical protein
MREGGGKRRRRKSRSGVNESRGLLILAALASPGMWRDVFQGRSDAKFISEPGRMEIMPKLAPKSELILDTQAASRAAVDGHRLGNRNPAGSVDVLVGAGWLLVLAPPPRLDPPNCSYDR